MQNDGKTAGRGGRLQCRPVDCIVADDGRPSNLSARRRRVIVATAGGRAVTRALTAHLVDCEGTGTCVTCDRQRSLFNSETTVSAHYNKVSLEREPFSFVLMRQAEFPSDRIRSNGISFLWDCVLAK